MSLYNNCFWEQHPVINIPVTGDFSAVASIVFNNLREIVIYSIEFETVVSTPFDSGGECISDSAGPENELIAIGLPFLKVIDKRLIGFATVRPFTETKGAVKVNGDNLIIAFHGVSPFTCCPFHSNPGRALEGLL